MEITYGLQRWFGVALHLTMPGSWDLETQQEISLRVSFLTTLMLAISGCFVTSSPVCTCMCTYVWGGGEWENEYTHLSCLVFLTTLLNYRRYGICTDCSSCSYGYHTTLAQHPQDETCLGIEGIVHAVEPHEFCACDVHHYCMCWRGPKAAPPDSTPFKESRQLLTTQCTTAQPTIGGHCSGDVLTEHFVHIQHV